MSTEPTTPADRFKLRDAWLERVGAVRMWQSVDKIHPIGTLTGYAIHGRAVIVHRHGCGWELFVPASHSDQTRTTLDDAAKFLSVEGCAGL